MIEIELGKYLLTLRILVILSMMIDVNLHHMYNWTTALNEDTMQRMRI